MADLEVISGEGVESIASRHRKERKDLQAKIQSLKKTASKGDKKKRKEVLEEIAKLEIDIEKKHAQELNDLNDAKSVKKAVVVGVESNGDPEEPNHQKQGAEPRLTKAQKRRDKKAKEERERTAEIEAQEEINKNGPRIKELQAIRKILAERGLAVYSIASDGDCLYNAVIHQLDVTGRKTHDVTYLRNETANYIVEHKDSLICYMSSPETGDLLTDDEFEKYCEAIRNTPAWGGQVEINALSHILEVPIEVLQATGPATIQGDGEFSGPPLILTYHRLMYSLGEHYNSTKPRTPDDMESDEEDKEPGGGDQSAEE